MQNSALNTLAGPRLLAAQRQRILVWLCLMCLAVLFGVIHRYFIQDDAYITYRFARNLSRGLGFVYNEGEWVLGTTTPFYTLLLALLAFITHLPVPLLSLTFNSLSLGIGAGIMFEIGRKESLGFAVGAALLYLTHPINFWAVGMESLFLNCLLLAAIWLYLRKELRWVALLVGILMVTRYEMVIFAGLLVGADFLTNRRIPLWIWPAFVIFGVWLGYAALAFGSPIPLSASAKLAASHIPFYTGLIFYGFVFVQDNFLYLGCLYFLLVGAISLFFKPKLALGCQLILIWTGLYFAAASLVAGSFPWYYAPLLPGLSILNVLGLRSMAAFLAKAYDRLRNGSRESASPILLLLLMISTAAIHLGFWQSNWRQYKDRPFDSRYAAYVSASNWLKSNATKEQSLATPEIGYLGYFSEMEIVDLFGLVSPGLSAWIPEGSSTTLENALRIYAPDFVLVPVENALQEVVMRNPDYELAQDFQNERFQIYRKRPANQP